jgi:hypothetical protein
VNKKLVLSAIGSLSWEKSKAHFSIVSASIDELLDNNNHSRITVALLSASMLACAGGYSKRE